MAPLTADQKKAFARSIAALLVVAVAFCGALLANRPLEKPVKFNAVCTSFVAPVPLMLQLHKQATEVLGTTAEGFEGTVTDVESGTLVMDGKQLSVGLSVGKGEFKLERSADVNQTSPHLDVKLSGGLGWTELRAGKDTVISSFGSADGRAWVNLESAQAKDVKLTLVSAASSLTGNRYLVSGTGLPTRMVKDLEAELKGAIATKVVLDSGAKGATVKVWLRTQTEEQQLLVGEDGEAAKASLPIEGQDAGAATSPLLRGCVNPDLRIEDKIATGVIADRSTGLEIRAVSGTIDGIGVIGGVEKTDAPRLRVQGEAEAKSLTQDGRELLPTMVSEAMDLPYGERGLLLIAVGFGLFVVFKIVDRTLSVLLEYFFPKVV
jgi:hypothetical protein